MDEKQKFLIEKTTEIVVAALANDNALKNINNITGTEVVSFFNQIYENMCKKLN